MRVFTLFFLSYVFAAAQIVTLTEQQEIEVGKRIAAEIEFEQPLFEDARTAAYIQKIGLRLARESERPGLRFSFKTLQSDDINAYALPGGFIYLTRGLIECVRDEHELAGAMAHEIGHIAARQHAGKIRRSQLANLGLGFLGPVGGGGMRLAATVKGARSGARGIFMRFTKENELEADRIGAKILYDSGYDAEGLLRFLQRINSLHEDDPKAADRYYRSHSKADDRLEALKEVLDTFPPRQVQRKDNAELLRIQKHIASVKPKGALTSSEAAAAVLEAAEDAPQSQQAKDRAVASLFAPLIYQALGDAPRYDYITNFDFDGDWRGDNNWDNAANKEFPLKAYVYYTVRETATHYFLHYAAFHPRDYKGGLGKGKFFSRVIRTAAKPSASVDPTGRAQEAVFAHENDLEGCLIVVEKNGPDPRRGKVAFVQTLAHNQFLKYVPESAPREGFEPFFTQGRRVKLFMEHRGHGMLAYNPQHEAAKQPLLLYTFTGQAEAPTEDHTQPVGYDLVPIETTLWPEAQRGLSLAYGDTDDYGIILLDLVDGKNVKEATWEIGRIGSAFRGKVGGENLARPPWGWFDSKDKTQPPGQWFFDPARVIRRDYGLDENFSTAYLRLWPGLEED
jgi:Zn-dependent protease with chaperone function